MRERVRLQFSDVSILTVEARSKASALSREGVAAAAEAKHRDLLRVTANKVSVERNRTLALLKCRTFDVDVLARAISGGEDELRTLRRQYDDTVAARNLIGARLMDSNDELATVLERVNHDDMVISIGTTALRQLAVEMNELRIAEVDVARRVMLSTASPVAGQPDRTPSFAAARVVELRVALEAATTRVTLSCAALESPRALTGRCVELPGHDPPTSHELRCRIAQFEERLGAARSKRLDAELDASVSVSRPLALDCMSMHPEGSKPCGDTAIVTPVDSSTCGDTQTQLRDVNRRLQALVSELSMLQAAAIRSAAELWASRAEIHRAEEAVIRGEAPSPAAAAAAAAAAASVAVSPISDVQVIEGSSASVGKVRSAVEPRQNAYVPDVPGGLGLPRPFGCHSPFRATLALRGTVDK